MPKPKPAEEQVINLRWAAAPLLAWAFVAFLPGLLVLVLMSVGRYTFGVATPENGWQILGRDPVVLAAIRATVALAGLGALVTAIAALPVAATLRFGVGPKWRPLLVAVLLLPSLSSLVVRAFSLQLWLGRQGVVSSLADLLGFPPTSLLNTPWATGIGWLTVQLPLVGVIQWLALARLGDDEVRAAVNLGAGPVSLAASFVLPKVFPGLVGGFVLSFVLSFSDLVMPSVLGGGSVYVASMALADMIKVNAIASAAALALVLGAVGLGAYGSLAILAATLAGARDRVRS